MTFYNVLLPFFIQINDFKSLEKEFAECRNKLSVAESQAQQLAQNDSSESRGQLEEVYQEKFELEKRLSLVSLYFNINTHILKLSTSVKPAGP